MKSIWPVAALIVIVGSVGYLLSYFGSQPKPGQTVEHMAPVACEACGEAYITMLGDQPAVCKLCGEQKLWRARQCVECGTVVPMIGGSGPGAPPLVCPKCGKKRFKEVSPNGLKTID